jgi:type I restriction enzyme S subunit
MTEWTSHNLGDLIEVQNGYAFKSKDFDEYNGTPVIKIKNVASGELRMDDIKYYPFAIEGLERFVVSNGDILIALTGSHVNQPSSIVGKVARYTIDEISLLNQRVGKICSLNENKTDEDFIYWFFKQWEVTLELALNAGGSANQANISGSLIKKLELELPPLPEQKAIASVLSSLDDKIDLLHRQNKILEAMAETLFRQWFVEEAQDDWEDGSLLELIQLVGGGTPKTAIAEYWDGDIPWLSGGDIASNHKSFVKYAQKKITEVGLNNSAAKLLPKHATVISARGTVGKYCLLAQPMAFSQSNYGILPKNSEGYFFTYLLINHVVEELQSSAYGSVFDTITTTTFKENKVPLP